ncbi:5-oxoprolinase subunit C family protein [Xanthobacter versatilis]|uniref:5-oxoprolinase subunit C family protein n=1 Tax=Xanthobacter autotrophicus (strain ATCC BAA-1158 / Py2) TaxID=78245 RepID=UPI00372C6BA2
MIEILSSTELVTVQDAGRRDLRRFGVGAAGALDVLALNVGNTLVGNAHDAAAIELLASPLTLRFTIDTAFAITGADAGAKLAGSPVPPWWTMTAPAGAELVLRPGQRGLSTYIAFAGGICVPLVLGSRSTDVKTGFGGLNGRPLAAGDRLSLGDAAMAAPAAGGPGFGVKPSQAALPAALPLGAGMTALRALPAAQHELFSQEARAIFWESDWTVRPDSNRMGLRLAGPDLVPQQRQELLSHGILPGVVQVPPSGQPIIQASDANTCGGYPKMAVVIGADLWRLGQLRPGGTLRFVRVEPADAMAALEEQRSYLASVARAAAIARQLGSRVERRASI